MELTIDFETRSAINLRKRGVGVYSEDPTTDIICAAVKPDDSPTLIWINPYFLKIIQDWRKLEGTQMDLPLLGAEEFSKMVLEAEVLEAHNATFERMLWKNVLFPRYKIPLPHLHRWRCSAAKAAAHALPRSLEGAGTALSLPIQKDMKGHSLMLRLSKPRQARKAEKEVEGWNRRIYWDETPEKLYMLCKYCMRDVDSERCLSSSLRNLGPSEQRLWELDQKINERGVNIDLELAHSALDIVDQHTTDLSIELDALTGGEVASAKQVEKMLSWLRSRGLDMTDLQAGTVGRALKNLREGGPPEVIRALEIRQSLSKSSTAKYSAFVDRASGDGRARHLHLFDGAATGRWAGMGIQPQNFPRPEFDDVDYCIDLILSKDVEMIEMVFGDPMSALSSCLRGGFCAPPGKDFIAADFSAIEGRVLAWVAGENYIIKNYEAGKDPYVVFAAQLFPEDYGTILAGKKAGIMLYAGMRFQGKTGELACGYQGGERAVKKFAPDMSIERRREIVEIWRDNRPKTVAFWKGIEKAALYAVRERKTATFRGIRIGLLGDFMFIRLPSGRVLSYYQPIIKPVKVTITKQCENCDKDPRCEVCGGEGSYKDTFVKDAITYMTVDSYTRKWKRTTTYGGKLTENIVQAISRCLLSDAMKRAEAAGYEVVLHVHDEIVTEVNEGEKSLEEFVDIITTLPAWAKGLPMKAEGWRGKRFRK